MNPGYLGRSELPEGLKALFRPITVVVPDLELICENMLMAERFIHSNYKVQILYKLNNCMKQLIVMQILKGDPLNDLKRAC